MIEQPDRTKDPDEDVALGDEVQVRRGRQAGPVVAVRMPRDLLARVSEYAQRRNTTVSDVLRQGAEQLVGGALILGPTYVSGVTIHGRSVVSGSPSIGRDYVWRNLEFEFRPTAEWPPEPLWGTQRMGEAGPAEPLTTDHQG